MIHYKKSQEIKIEGGDPSAAHRTTAFAIYQNLLKGFDSAQLLLLESWVPGRSDAKSSLIGINPVLKLEVFDRIVTIHGNEQLLRKVDLLYKLESLVESAAGMLRYILKSRHSVWDFLRVLDREFTGLEGGVFAFTTFGYNTIYFIEDIVGYAQGDIPDICLTCYASYIEFDDDRVMLHEYGFVGSETVGLSRIRAYLSLFRVVPRVFVNHTFEIHQETCKNNYLQKAATALRHVQMGDVYQIQIGQAVSVVSNISAFEVYSNLRFSNPSPFMYLFHCADYEVIGASPELFVYMNNDEVLMRPIAGTLGKSLIPNKETATTEFRKNEKEIAEHMMLVDLCRNDLCRVSLPNSLKIEDLMCVEEYSHVYHMVTTAKATVRGCYDKYDLIRASFPAGTMTGAPKIRAIELISELEDSARGLYAGALGIIGLGDNYINTALCIRTTIRRNNTFVLRASAGIVSDSRVECEYSETLQKMGAVFKAITNEELSCHLM